jgi:DNA polymerase-3 subunit alpha
VYRLLQKGDARGVFQLESPGIRELLKRLKPDNIRDIIALMALYRPGPLEGGMVDSYVNRKHGTEKATYAHPVMKEVLEETHGVMVYQEQIMRILNRLGGIELSSAYACIKAISKKKQDTIDQRREEFIRGAGDRGLARETAEEIFQLIVVFGGYGFNKSHSAAYAMIGYHTAYLKTHYLAEFMAALLTSEIDDANKRDILVEHIGDARRLGVEVLAPDINQSEGRFHVKNGKIVFGMTAIKGVGAGASEAIMAARTEGGLFKDIFEFCERVDPRLVPKTAIEKLIKAGAMDTFCSNRARMMAGLNGAVQGAVHRQNDLKRGQGNLFDLDIGSNGTPTQDSSPELPDVPAWPEAERLKYEKEVLDFYFSSHPLAVYEQDLKRFITHQIGDLKGKPGEEEVILAGIVTTLKSGNTKKARNGLSRFLRFKLQDLSDVCDCVIWPDDLAKLGEDPLADGIYYVKGRLEVRGDQPSIVVSRVLTIDQAKRELAKGLYLRLRLDTHQNSTVDQLNAIIRKGLGSVPVFLKIHDAMEFACTLKLGKEFDVNPQKISLADLEQLLGADNVRLG